MDVWPAFGWHALALKIVYCATGILLLLLLLLLLLILLLLLFWLETGYE